MEYGSKQQNAQQWGLALAGGGARGIAHIGVLKVLMREGLAPAGIAGTSIGGLVGAFYAAGKLAALEEAFLRLARTRERLRLLDRSRHGLISGGKLAAMVDQVLGPEMTFTDLAIPVWMTAVDLATGEEVTLRAGRLRDAIRATTAVPGAFAPAQVDGRTLIDGGVLNNFPVDVARAMGLNVVIGVDIIQTLNDSFSLEAAGWPPLPAAVQAAVRSMQRGRVIAMRRLTQLRLAVNPPDLIIRPDVPPEITVFGGFQHAAALISLGEQAAEAVLPEVHSLLHQAHCHQPGSPRAFSA